MTTNYYSAKKYEVRKSIGHLVRAISTRLSAAVADLFEDQDLSFIQYVVLMHLRDGLVNTSAELCQNMCYDSGAITRVIDQLEERGLLTRSRSTDDRRVINLHITPLGLKTAESMLPEVVELYNSWLTHFTLEEANTLIALLTKLHTVITPNGKGKE